MTNRHEKLTSAFWGALIGLGVIVVSVVLWLSTMVSLPSEREILLLMKRATEIGSVVGVLVTAAFVGIVLVTGLLLWNFLYHVGTADSELSQQIKESGNAGRGPLPHAGQLPLEGG